MDAVNYSNFRKNLKHYFKEVNESRVPIIITNKYLMDKINRGRKQVAEGKTSLL